MNCHVLHVDDVTVLHQTIPGKSICYCAEAEITTLRNARDRYRAVLERVNRLVSGLELPGLRMDIKRIVSEVLH